MKWRSDKPRSPFKESKQKMQIATWRLCKLFTCGDRTWLITETQATICLLQTRVPIAGHERF
jgi:hypothetical protein